MQVAFYGADRHMQHIGDFSGVEIFLIAKQHDHTRVVGEIRDAAAQTIVEKKVGSRGFGGRLGNGFQADPRAQAALARFVNTSVADRTAQPAGGVAGAFDTAETLVELKENVLRKLFGAGAVAQKTQGEAEDERLVVGKYAVEVQPHTG